MVEYIQGGQKPSPEVLAKQEEDRARYDQWARTGEWFMQVVEETSHPRRSQSQATPKGPYKIPETARSLLAQEDTCAGHKPTSSRQYSDLFRPVRGITSWNM